MTAHLTDDGSPVIRPFSVLMVCTGNICRSPLAEQLLRARLAEAGVTEVEVASAGLGALVDAPMDTIPADISARLGGSPGSFLARQLSNSIVQSADLVLTMTREQRDIAIQRYPRALRRSFTIVEFTSLLALSADTSPTVDDSGIPGLLRGRVGEFTRLRSRVRLSAGDDITDPYRRSRKVHEAVGEQIALACSQIAHNFSSWSIDGGTP